MKLFESVPSIIDKHFESLGLDYELNEDRCMILAYACAAVDELIESNKDIEEYTADVEIDDTDSIVIELKTNVFVIDGGKTDPLFKSIRDADKLVFSYVDDDTVSLKITFSNLWRLKNIE